MIATAASSESEREYLATIIIADVYQLFRSFLIPVAKWLVVKISFVDFAPNFCVITAALFLLLHLKAVYRENLWRIIS
jgi:hypothetical protein